MSSHETKQHSLRSCKMKEKCRDGGRWRERCANFRSSRHWDCNRSWQRRGDRDGKSGIDEVRTFRRLAGDKDEQGICDEDEVELVMGLILYHLRYLQRSRTNTHKVWVIPLYL